MLDRRGRRGIGRTEIAIGVGAVVLVIALALILMSGGSGKQEQRAELPANVDSICQHEIAFKGAFEDYVSAEAAPRAFTALGPEPVAWEPSRGFKKLSWAPKNKETVYGSYQVVATEDGFEVTGMSDIDGDGEKAVYKASHTFTGDEKDGQGCANPAKATTGDDVY